MAYQCQRCNAWTADKDQHYCVYERLETTERKLVIACAALKRIWDLGTDGTKGGPVKGAARLMTLEAVDAMGRIEMEGMTLVRSGSAKV